MESPRPSVERRSIQAEKSITFIYIFIARAGTLRTGSFAVPGKGGEEAFNNCSYSSSGSKSSS